MNDIRQWTAKRHPGCTTAICHNKMERAGSLISMFIVADPGRSTAIPVKPFLTKNSFFHPFRVNPDLIVIMREFLWGVLVPGVLLAKRIAMVKRRNSKAAV